MRLKSVLYVASSVFFLVALFVIMFEPFSSYKSEPISQEIAGCFSAEEAVGFTISGGSIRFEGGPLKSVSVTMSADNSGPFLRTTPDVIYQRSRQFAKLVPISSQNSLKSFRVDDRGEDVRLVTYAEDGTRIVFAKRSC